METDITLIALGYVAARLGLLLAFGYVIYRVLRHRPAPVKADDRSRYAEERVRAFLARR